MSDAIQLLSDAARHVESALQAAFDARAGIPDRLAQAMRHSLLAGGKRLRPTLVIEWFRASGAGDPDRVALSAACAIEMIHTFSLIHDDLPAMDNDDFRRGRPTCHKAFDEATAVLAGDALTTLAFEIIADSAPPEIAVRLILDLACATGPQGMIGGQMLDIQSEGRSLPIDALREIHAGKTGALIRSACRMGAIAGRGTEDLVTRADSFGRHLGLAFQIVDDILDVTATPEQLGKGTNKDAGAGKNTYPALLGLDESRRLADAELDAALACLQGLPGEDRLSALARFVVTRNH
jgi:geranylgeranyl diphosphate synthase type II